MKKTTRFLALILACILCVSLFSISASAYSTVRKGSSGSDVKTLQTMLNKVSNAGLVVDGIFGNATKTAVQNFQSKNGLSVDGICGPKTWAALTEQYNSVIITGNYVITTALKNNMVLDVSGNGTANKTNIQIYTANGTAAQTFTVTHVNSGWHKITNTASGKALDVAGGSSKSGTNVQLYEYNGTAAQLWKFVPAGSGRYYIQNKLGCYLDVSGAGTANGTNVQVYTGNKTAAQIWVLSTSTTTVSSTASLRATYAKQILQNSKITLAKAHPSGVKDNAFAYNNIVDTANGKAASRSNYGNAPGGTVYLDADLLKILLDLEAKYGSVIVSEIAGASHSKNSLHYQGKAMDITYVGSSVTKQRGIEIYNYLTSKGYELKTVQSGTVYEDSSHYHIALKK